MKHSESILGRLLIYIWRNFQKHLCCSGVSLLSISCKCECLIHTYPWTRNPRTLKTIITHWYRWHPITPETVHVLCNPPESSGLTSKRDSNYLHGKQTLGIVRATCDKDRQDKMRWKPSIGFPGLTSTRALVSNTLIRKHVLEERQGRFSCVHTYTSRLVPEW